MLLQAIYYKRQLLLNKNDLRMDLQNQCVNAARHIADIPTDASTLVLDYFVATHNSDIF